jgi:hypothetical protein
LDGKTVVLVDEGVLTASYWIETPGFSTALDDADLTKAVSIWNDVDPTATQAMWTQLSLAALR